MILFEASIRALVLAAGVGALLYCARVRGSADRHAAWTAVLVTMLLMPIAARVAPPIVIRSLTVPVQWMSEPDVAPAALTSTDAVSESSGASAAPTLPASASTSAAQRGLQTSIPVTPSTRITTWFALIALIYVSGVLVFAGRFAIGWRAMRRVVHSSQPTSLPTGGSVFESAAIATPLTVGILKPRIVLPLSWTTWSDEMREAVLTHERAHVRRHDALVAFLAHLNRCVFWFHPLAWSLERTLWSTAEEACDDACVQAMKEPRKYAEVLIAIASAVRAQGGRVAWQGLGVGGNGSLDRRIDRVLRGQISLPLSWRRRAMVAAGGTAVIVIAIACQAQTALRADPAVAAKQADEEARRAPYRERGKTLDVMTAEKAAAMEVGLRSNPDDRHAHEILIEYYGWKSKIAPEQRAGLKRPHALWLIEHAPEADVTGQWAKFYPGDKGGDLTSYEAGRQRWLAHLAQPHVSARLLRNAASYFQDWETPKAEELLLRGQSEKLVDPDDPGRPWWGDLAELYATVLNREFGSVVRQSRTPPYDEHAYALAVQQKLSESNNADLLAVIAYRFVSPYTYRLSGDRGAELRRIGHAALDHALLLDPQNAAAKGVKARIQTLERDARLPFLNAANPGSTSSAEFTALSDADKFYILPRMAKWTEKKGDDASRSQARAYADQALLLGPRFHNDPDYSSTVFMAHMTLGVLDMQANNREQAKQHLLAASEVPSAVELWPIDVQNSLLVVGLLKDHEHAAVITFLERLGKLSASPGQQKWMLESAEQIRKGVMPEWYQRTMK